MLEEKIGEDDYERITYLPADEGVWTLDRHFGRTYARTTTNGSSALVRFTGSSVRVMGAVRGHANFTRDPPELRVRVELDGGAPQLVVRRGGAAWDGANAYYEHGGLAEAEHSVRMTYLRTDGRMDFLLDRVFFWHADPNAETPTAAPALPMDSGLPEAAGEAEAGGRTVPLGMTIGLVVGAAAFTALLALLAVLWRRRRKAQRRRAESAGDASVPARGQPVPFDIHTPVSPTMHSPSSDAPQMRFFSSKDRPPAYGQVCDTSSASADAPSSDSGAVSSAAASVAVSRLQPLRGPPRNGPYIFSDSKEWQGRS